MKKALLLAIVAMFAFGAMAQASTVSFTWGANYATYANAVLGTSVGTASQLNWYADDFGYGIRTEANSVQVALLAPGTINITEVTVDKWLSNSVAVGLGLGQAAVTAGGVFSASPVVPVVDVRGTVKLLAGKGEKVNASLDFNLDARFANTGAMTANGTACPNLNATVATLAVTLGM